MKNNFKELEKQFNIIKNKGWIKSKRNGSTGIGYTFENLLGKEEENFFIPDFKNIEIKTMRKYSKGQLHLINITPDGDFLFPIKRILEILGYPDKENPEYKVFNTAANGKEFTNIGYYKRIKLIANEKEEKLELIATNNNLENLNLNVSWSFALLKERLDLKLKYLAIIKADTKFTDKTEYFHYNQIKFYKLKSFDTFLSLIEKGYITVTFKIGVFKSGKRIGQIHDRGTDFSIKEKDIELLYEKCDI